MSSTKLKGVLKRRIRISGVVEPVNLRVTKRGFEIAASGSSKKLSTEWGAVLEFLKTPDDSPSYVANRPVAWLNHVIFKLRH